jgi:hypothetical protein
MPQDLTALNAPRFGKDWRMRWFYLGDGAQLHRIAAITFQDEDRINGHGATACGRFGFMWMPGLGGRIGARRCPSCCKEMGVPQGSGAPFNEGIDA